MGKPQFAFIVHSRDVSDVSRKYKIAKIIPNFLLELFCKYKKPLILSKITGLKSQITGEEIPGIIIGCPITAKQMLRDRKLAQKRIFQAVKLAEKKGVKLVGLGALTASLTRGGKDIVEKYKNIKITSGHAGTAYSVTTTAKKILQTLEKDFTDTEIAIVGVAGSIGSISAKILAKENPRKLLFIDVHRKRQMMVELEQEILKTKRDINIEIYCDIKRINNADLVIAATNSPEVVIQPEYLKSGAVIVNDAQPSDVSTRVYKRKDTLVLEGGIIHSYNISCHFNMGLAFENDVFSCLAEVIGLLSIGKIESYTLGRVSENQVSEIGNIFKKIGFFISEFQNREGIIKQEKIDKIKNECY